MNSIEKQERYHDIVVVGAGPTGLMLACELKLKGINVALIERRAHGTSGESRAPGINARTMEIFEMRGLAEDFKKLGMILPAVLFAGMPMNPKALDPGWPDALILPQHHTERLLTERATELGVCMYWSAELLHFKQDEDGVDILIQSGGEVESLKVLYVAGCDGGHSVVRRILGISFNGVDPLSHWLVADVELDSPPAKKDSFGRNTKVGTFQVSKVEPGWYRVNIMKITPPIDRSAPVTLEELRQAMIEGLNTDYGLRNARWISRYGDGFRQVERYRHGRVLLLGDAAHTHSPVGGQGLNLGIQDAMNLGWKLALVVTGQASETLLDSFHDERHDVATSVLQLSKAQTALVKPGEQIEALRTLMETMIKVPETTIHLSGVLSGLGVRYANGEGLHPLVGRSISNLGLSLHDGKSDLFQMMRNGRPLFINFNAKKKISLPEGYQSSIDVITTLSNIEEGLIWRLPVIGNVPALTNLLLRPDGYVAWALVEGEQFVPDDLNKVLKCWFGDACR